MSDSYIIYTVYYIYIYIYIYIYTNLNSVLKSKEIILLTKVCIVKAMVSPVVMYRCESWAINKAEC